MLYDANLSCVSNLEATHGQVVLVAGVPSEAEHGEGDGGGGQAGQRQLPLAGVRLLQERRQLEHCDLNAAGHTRRVGSEAQHRQVQLTQGRLERGRLSVMSTR